MKLPKRGDMVIVKVVRNPVRPPVTGIVNDYNKDGLPLIWPIPYGMAGVGVFKTSVPLRHRSEATAPTDEWWEHIDVWEKEQADKAKAKAAHDAAAQMRQAKEAA